ncbi:MAG: PD-(D/E)XK nuclease family protein [Actinobacteria bacterium]|nr:PD-(D/E)XK nuclease family protein [Actinomycetota bacterium]
MAFPLPSSLTPSKVSSFTNCGLAFRFSAIDRLPEPPSLPAAKGTVVHRALQLLHNEAPEQRTLARALEALDVALPEVMGSWEYAEMELDEPTADKFRSDAVQLVTRYFELEDPTQVTPVGLELMLEAEIGGVFIRGIIDRLDLTADGELIVTDYKTGRAPNERFEQGSLNGVHFYAYLCEAVFGKRPAKVQLLYLSQPVSIVATPTDQSIRGMERKVGAVWKAVEQACRREDFRPNPGKLCDWCAFQAHCPAFGGDPSLVVNPRSIPVAVS